MLVQESISFQRGADPKNTLGIGQKYLIEKWLKEMNIDNYIINADLTIDVNLGVDLTRKNLINFPDYIQFNKTKNFWCGENKLKSLRGCPVYVDGNFGCSANKIISLDGCPKIINGSFICTSPKFSRKYIEKFCQITGNILT